MGLKLKIAPYFDIKLLKSLKSEKHRQKQTYFLKRKVGKNRICAKKKEFFSKKFKYLKKNSLLNTFTKELNLYKLNLHIGALTKNSTTILSRYLLCSRNRVDIFNTIYLKYNFIKLFSFWSHLFSTKDISNVTILFCSINKAYAGLLQQSAQYCGMPYKVNRWTGGTLTNYSGLKLLSKYPDFLFIPDVQNNSIIINEAQSLGIPIIGIINTNSMISVDYPIFGSDGDYKTVLLITAILSNFLIKIKKIKNINPNKYENSNYHK